jgi:thiamine biosynthesis lipoprotein
LLKFSRLKRKLDYGYRHAGVREYAVKPMLTHHQQRIALGSPIDLTIVTSAGEHAADEIFRKLWLRIFEFERRFSRFLPASELSVFNRSAGMKVVISQEFYEILTKSLEMSMLTNGLYNPFILPALQTAGYVHSMVAAHRKDAVDDFSNRTVVRADRLHLDGNQASIPYGTAIDLGGIGKGYIGDILALMLDEQKDIDGYWLSLGGDVVAGGCDQTGDPWHIQVEDTGAAEFSIAGVAVPSKRSRHAVATSSSLRRSGKKEGRSWHHIIDPRTNQPSNSDVVTASVQAESLCLADILASCAVILGSGEATVFCKERGATGVLLQTTEGEKVLQGDFEPTA